MGVPVDGPARRWRRIGGVALVLLVLALLAAVPGLGLGPTPGWAHDTGCGTDPGPNPETPRAEQTSLPDLPWPLARLRPDRVWPVTKGGGVTVAVIDSGVSDAHPALRGQVLDGVDLVEPGRDGHCDEAGHGTLIAGIIAGKENVEGSRFTGIAPEARILPIRVLKDLQASNAAADAQRIVNGIRTAVDRGAKVINLSLTTGHTPALANAVNYAFANDVVLVAAAGNYSEGQDLKPGDVLYPAAYENVIGVAGIYPNGVHVDTSVTGIHVDLSAPGFDIYGPTLRTRQFRQFPGGGTSFATAYVSGTAALIRAARPDLPAAEVIRRIKRTVDRVPEGWNPQLGNGVLNLYWAVMSISGEEQNEPGPPQQVVLRPPDTDPQRRLKLIAVSAVIVSILLSAMLIGGVSVWRAGVRRGWRPGRPPP